MSYMTRSQQRKCAYASAFFILALHKLISNIVKAKRCRNTYIPLWMFCFKIKNITYHTSFNHTHQYLAPSNPDISTSPQKTRSRYSKVVKMSVRIKTNSLVWQYNQGTKKRQCSVTSNPALPPKCYPLSHFFFSARQSTGVNMQLLLYKQTDL